MADDMSYQDSFKTLSSQFISGTSTRLAFTGILVRFCAQRVLDKQLVMIEVVY